MVMHCPKTQFGTLIEMHWCADVIKYLVESMASQILVVLFELQSLRCLSTILQ